MQSISKQSETQSNQGAEHVLKELFWRRGFAETSIENVVQATGMNRYALYNAYGGKRELFLTALDTYYAERKNIFLEGLNDPEMPPLEAVRRVFEFAIREMADRGTGCLMCNVATQFAPVDDGIAERIEAYLSEIRWAYTEALNRASKRGELNENVSPSAGADILITLKLGLGVQAKTGRSCADMLATLDGAMRALSKQPNSNTQRQKSVSGASGKRRPS